MLNKLKNLFGQPAPDTLTLEQLADRLHEDATPLSKHLRTAKDNDTNHALLSRVIGAERWGQVRLKAFLGEALPEDTPEAYRPLDHLDWDMLTSQFWATRKETVALARQIAGAGIDEAATVAHPHQGNLTAHVWLHHLATHTKKEINRIR
jgi:hypothetical protein